MTVNKKTALLSFIFLFSFCFQVQAKNSVEYIRYLAEQTSVREIAENKIIRMVQGSDPVYFHFTADEKLCREKYGDDAQAVCGRRFQDILPDAGQISLTPPMEGKWQWQSDSSLVFYPGNEWTPGTKYTVQFGKESLPKLTVVTKPVQFMTQILKPQVFTAEFKFDPENPQKMVIAGSVSFNYKVSRESLEKKVALRPANINAVLLGEMETSFHNNTLHFSVPVLKVGEKAEEVKAVLVSGVQGANGGKTAATYEFTAKIPAKSEIFKLAGYESGVENMPDMSAKQNIVAEFSLPVLPKELNGRIEAVLLPREKVQTKDAEENPPYTWWSQAEITPDVLKKSEPLALELVGDINEPNRFLTMVPKESVEAGRCAYIIIKAPVKGPDNFVIDRDCTMLVQFKSLDSTVKFMQKGSLLSLHGDKKLSLYARNAEKIVYTVRQIRPEFINSYVALLKQARGGMVQGYELDPLSIVHTGSLPLAFVNAEKAQFASLDLNPFLQNRNKGLFHITLEAKKEDKVLASDSRFIMLSDIGMILKADDSEENVQVYLVSLESKKPVSGAEVQVLGANGIALFTGKSDGSGLVKLPSLKGYEREKQVVAITAGYENDLAILPYIDYRLALRPKNTVNTYGKVFDKDSISGFAFSQRDVYRAGETVHLGFILKQGDFKAGGLENVPLSCVVYAGNGQVAAREKVKLSPEGMGEFSFKLSDTAVNGVYTFYVENADHSVLAAKDFHVMDFVPDTIKAQIENNMASPKKWFGRRDLQDLAFTVSAENLFGAPAANTAVKAKLMYTPMTFAFDGEYRKFKFYDPVKLDKASTQELGTFQTDDRGKAVIKIDRSLLIRESHALTLQAEVQDAHSSLIVKNVLYASPARAVMGYFTKSNLAFLTQNEKAELDLVALDPFGKLFAKGELSAELYRSDLVRSLVKTGGEYKYTKVRREKLLSRQAFSLPAEKTPFSLDTSETGDKLLVFKDKKDRIVLQIRYTVVGDSTVQFDEYKNADLQVNIDNKEYQAGSSLRAAIKTPYEGAGLITLEREKVYAEKWFNADKGNIIEEIEIPKDLEGKAYLNVVYFRGMEDGEIFTEPCASVVLPFTVDTAKRRLDLDLTAAGGAGNFTARPGEEFTVKVTAAEKAKVIIYAVDEGIIQLTGYQKPDPIKEFFLDRALSVQTYQYLDTLMPEFSLMQKQLAKFGGDLFGAKMANAMRDAALNPFKAKNSRPAVFWSGLLDTDKNGREVRIPVPETFNGSLRIFAVACSDGKMASVQKDVLCQAEIVIQPSLPLFVSPTDEFEASIALTDMRRDKKQDNLEFAANFGEGFEVLGEEKQSFAFDAKGQKIFKIRVRVKDTNEVLGEHTVHFTVTDGQNTVRMPAVLSVRPASSLYTVTKIGKLAKKGGNYAEQVVLTRNIYPQYAVLDAALSSAPIPYVQALLQRIDSMPYPSTVQAAARAMPMLYLLQHKEYAPQTEAYTEKSMREEITDCLNTLRSSFNYQEVLFRFGDYGRLSAFELSFVLDFITSAKEQGINVDPYVFNNIVSRMEQKCSAMPESLEEARAYAYGAWCLTRNGVITSQIMANLTTWLQQNHKNWESDICAVLMAGSMKLMMQDELAEMLMAKYVPAKTPYSVYGGFNGLAERALYLSVAAKVFPGQLSSAKTQTILDELYSLLQEYFVKTSEALAVRSIMEYGISQNAEPSKSVLALKDKAGNAVAGGALKETNGIVHTLSLKNDPAIANAGSVEMQADKALYYSVSLSGYDKDFAKDAKQAFSVTREFRDADGYPLKEFRAGDEIVVAVKARSMTGRQEKVLITDILPSAFEFVMTKAGNAESFRTAEGKSNQDVLQEEKDMSVEFADRQQDRVLLFAELSGEESVFRYKVRVGSRGNFVLPDIMVQSVENPLLIGRDLTVKDRRIIAE